MSELNDLTIASFNYTASTPTVIITAFLSGTDWTVGTIDPVTAIALKSDKRISILEALNLLADKCSCELNFTEARLVDLKTTIGTVTETQIRYDKNSDYIERQEDSSQICTRLYCYGRDNITIASVNGGIETLDSANYYDYRYPKEKAIYTNIATAADLLTYAQAYLAVYEIPILSYKTNVMDLAKISTWQSETINLGDTLRIYDSILDLNIKVRVMKIVKDYSSENIYIELANRFDRVTKTLADLLASLSNITFDNDSRALDIRDVTFSGTFSGESGIPICFVFVISGILSVDEYQGPVIGVHKDCTAYEIWAYIAEPVYTGAESDIDINLYRNGSSIGSVTIPPGSQSASTSIDVSLSVDDLLNLGISRTDGVSELLTLEVRCK